MPKKRSQGLSHGALDCDQLERCSGVGRSSNLLIRPWRAFYIGGLTLPGLAQRRSKERKKACFSHGAIPRSGDTSLTLIGVGLNGNQGEEEDFHVSSSLRSIPRASDTATPPRLYVYISFPSQ